MRDLLDFALENRVALIGACLALVLAGERLAPALAWRGGRPRLSRNFCFWALNFGLALGLAVPLTAWASGSALDWRPRWLEGAAGFALDILLLDLLWYWWHRAHHAAPLLWRFHEVHHLDEFLDASTTFRTHFGELSSTIAVRVAFFLAMDISLVSLLVFELAGTIVATLQHVNARLGPPGLGRALTLVFVTPSVHWVHHFSADEYKHCNYGLIFSFWDRAFGSFKLERRSAGTGIGIEGTPDAPFAALLARPFRRRAEGPAPAGR